MRTSVSSVKSSNLLFVSENVTFVQMFCLLLPSCGQNQATSEEFFCLLIQTAQKSLL